MEVKTITNVIRPAGLLLVALLMLPPPGPASAASEANVTIAAGPPGGLTPALARALADLIPGALPHLDVRIAITSGPPESMSLLGAKRADLAFSGAPVLWEAFRGEGGFTGNPIPARTLMPLQNLIEHLVTLEGTGINTAADLRGKRVVVGPPPPGDPAFERDAGRIMRVAGIDPDRDIQRVRLGVEDSAVAMRERRIDAFFTNGTLPIPGVLALAASGVPMRLVPLEAVLSPLNKGFGPTWIRVTIAKEFYPGLAAGVPTIAVPVLLVARVDLRADLAYQITRLIYEKRPELAQMGVALARYITLIDVPRRSPIPFHPGAIRYFKERGVEGF